MTEEELDTIAVRATDREVTNSARGWYIERASGATIAETRALVAEVRYLRAELMKRV